MGWRNNKDTIVTNVVQQSCSIFIFLVVPNILQVEHYAQVVFVGTLLSFITFSDFGLSFVYSRKMPVIYASENVQEARRWNDTVFFFRVSTALLFGLIISFVYYLKYKEFLNAALLFLTPALSTAISFFVAQHTAKSTFSVYREINSFQAIARLITIVGVVLFGLLGWFISQVVASLLTMVKVLKSGGVPREFRIDFGLLKEHLREGVLLGLITTLWTQLLSSGKVFASFMYADTEITQYGLLNTGYQIVAAFVIAAFIPQTVKVYGMIETNFQHAIKYVFRTILYAIPIVVGLAIISREITPYVLMHLFPKYQIDPLILVALIFSLPFYPVIVTLGSILVAKQKSPVYLLLITFSVLINWTLVIVLNPYYGFRSAAIAQIVTLFLYSIFLLGLVFYLFKNDIKNKMWLFCKIYGSLSGLLIIYYFLRCKLILI